MKFLYFLPLFFSFSCSKTKLPPEQAVASQDAVLPEPDVNAAPALGDTVEPALINGKELDIAKWPYVVRIQTGNAGCTATVVGPKAVITAAHCGNTGDTSNFKIGGIAFSGKVTRSDLYPRQDHDISLIVTDVILPKPYATVGGVPAVDMKIFLAGYGCIRPGGGGGNDGILRGGFATISGFSGYDIVSGGKKDEAALCFGDSGGPMFTAETPDKPVIMGINSKGNIRDTSYNANLASAESKAFLNKMASSKSLEICGINGTALMCGGNEPPPSPPPPPPGDCDGTKKKMIILDVAACLGIPVVVPAFSPYNE